MQKVVRDEKSQWSSITRRVPQGSFLAPIMFLISVNDILQGINSYRNLLADDAKL